MTAATPPATAGPFLSIVVPVYNTDRFLSRCIQSVLNQDYPGFELILINDGSTDSSPQICDRFADRDNRVCVIHKRNEGAAAARNEGIRRARGDYLFFLDSDDWIDGHTLRDNAGLAGSTEADMIVFGYTKKMIKEESTYLVHSELPEVHLKTAEQIAGSLCSLLDAGIRYSAWNKFIKTNLIRENGITYPVMHRGEDMAFTMDCYCYAKSLAVNPERYYFHENIYRSEKYNSDVFKNHLNLFDRFYNLYSGWMDRKRNRQFAAKLFVFWFFFKIPKIIIENSLTGKDARSDLKYLLEDERLNRYVGIFSSMKIHRWSTRIPLAILRSGNVRLLYHLNTIIRLLENRLKRKLK